MSAKTAALAASPHLLGTHPLWNHPGFKLPNYLEAVAQGIMKSGTPRGEAIAIAESRLRHWAAGGGQVSAEVRAASAAAIAQFDRMRAELAGHGGSRSRTSRIRAALTSR